MRITIAMAIAILLTGCASNTDTIFRDYYQSRNPCRTSPDICLGGTGRATIYDRNHVPQGYIK